MLFDQKIPSIVKENNNQLSIFDSSNSNKQQLPLSDQFNYPSTMHQFNSFQSFLTKQSTVDCYEEQLLKKLAGMGLVECNLNMSMFQTKKFDGPLPFVTWEIPETWEEPFTSDTGRYELERVFGRLQEIALKGYNIFPLEADIFRSFRLCRRDKLKVVILGQDPYPQKDLTFGLPLANGLSFSGRKGGIKPGSLDTIFAEISRTFPGIPLQHYDLTSWAEQGVLLLNTCPTVNEGDAGSHIKLGIWKYFMDYIIQYICESNPNVIFLLWGSKAEEFATRSDAPIGKKILKLICGHPSGKNQSAKKFTENSHFGAIFYEIQKRNQEIHTKNIQLYQQGQQQLDYIEQINWALLN
jgi:uracil-DNA glycosylase